MSTTTTANSARRDFGLVLPAVAVALLYGLVTVVWGQPGGAAARQARTELAAAKAAAVPEAQVQMLTQQRETKTREVAELRSKLKQARGEAELLGRKGSQSNQSLELHSPTSNVLELLADHDLFVAKDHAVAGGGGQEGMAASLQKATRGLLTALVRAEDQPAAPQTQAEIAAQLDAQAEARAAGLQGVASPINVNVSPLLLRELEVHGGYANMLSALKELAESDSACGVISLGMERQLQGSGKSSQLVWKLVLHVQSDGKSSQEVDRQLLANQ